MVCTCSFSTLFLQLASLLGQFQQLHRWGVGAGEGGCTSEAVESGQEGKWTELGHHNNVLTLIWSNVDSSRVVMPQVLTIFFPIFWQLVGRNNSRGVTWQTKKSVRKIFLDTIFWEETFCIIFSLVWTWTLTRQHTLVRPTSDLTVFVTEFGFNTSHCAHQKWFDQGPSQPRFTFHIIGFTSVALLNIQQAAAAWLSISHLPLSHPHTWNEQCHNFKYRKITTF